MNKEIDQMCKEFNIIYMEIINIANLERWVCGKFEELPYKGLHLNLLDDEIKIRNLIEMFDKDEELHTWRQGDMVLLVFRKQTYLVCVFYVTDKKGLESFQYSQNIFSRFKEIDKIQ